MEESGTSRSSGKSKRESVERSAERRRLTATALNGLLHRLDSDRDQAGERYEALRRRLHGLLRWWGAGNPLDLADQTLDRVAMKLDEGAVVSPAALPGYVRGVARLVFHESLRERERAERALHEFPAGIADPDRDGALAALDSCLDSLEPVNRRLVINYYAAQGTSMIEARRRLASEMNLSPTALRIRVHRLRQHLEECVAASLGGRA